MMVQLPQERLVLRLPPAERAEADIVPIQVHLHAQFLHFFRKHQLPSMAKPRLLLSIWMVAAAISLTDAEFASLDRKRR